MRVLIKNSLSKEDAEELMANRSDVTSDRFSNPIVVKLLDKCKEYIGRDVNTNQPSYLRINSTTAGHNWHMDTGTNGHMTWCQYGMSTLLSPPKEGGIFKYKEPDIEYSQKEHYLNTILHTSDQWHMVEPSEEKRTVLLMFIA
tara:strand:- start:933 stop:1361 length:429 start_codon:yes stop_codon:yes gene_type:complete